MGALIPDRIEAGFDRLQPDWLRSKGIRLVLADLDNTLTRYRQLEPDPALITWRDALHQAGITLFVVSNSRRPNRAQQFCANLDVPYISHAGKPHAAAFHQAMERCGCQAAETIMIGDQIFTDIWGGHNAGIRAVYIRPIALNTLFRKIRYGIEAPFRLLCRMRGERL